MPMKSLAASKSNLEPKRISNRTQKTSAVQNVTYRYIQKHVISGKGSILTEACATGGQQILKLKNYPRFLSKMSKFVMLSTLACVTLAAQPSPDYPGPLGTMLRDKSADGSDRPVFDLSEDIWTLLLDFLPVPDILNSILPISDLIGIELDLQWFKPKDPTITLRGVSVFPEWADELISLDGTYERPLVSRDYKPDDLLLANLRKEITSSLKKNTKQHKCGIRGHAAAMMDEKLLLATLKRTGKYRVNVYIQKRPRMTRKDGVETIAGCKIEFFVKDLKRSTEKKLVLTRIAWINSDVWEKDVVINEDDRIYTLPTMHRTFQAMNPEDFIVLVGDDPETVKQEEVVYGNSGKRKACRSRPAHHPRRRPVDYNSVYGPPTVTKLIEILHKADPSLNGEKLASQANEFISNTEKILGSGSDCRMIRLFTECVQECSTMEEIEEFFKKALGEPKYKALADAHGWTIIDETEI